MSTITQTVASKAVVAFVAIAMIFTMFATPAQAQTAEELQAQIAQLLEQINALQADLSQGGSTATAGVCPFTWTRDLSMGSTGADVMKLQQFLNADADTRVAATGVGSAGMETMYYGAMTAAAVSKMQMKYMSEVLTPNGLMSGTGYFGPSSRAKANAVCSTAVVVPGEGEGEGSTGSLQGGEASMTVDTLLDSDVIIDLGKAEEVIEFEVEAEDADLSINRVDFIFNLRPWLYFEEVNLMVDGEEVASFDDEDDFSETGSNYRARFTGLDIVVEEDETAVMTLELVTRSSLAGDRDEDTVEVTLPVDGIRYIDGAGLTSYEPSTAIGPVDVDFEEDFGTGAITVSVSSDSPENATIVLDEDARTNGVTVLEFEVEADNSDVEVEDVTVEFDVDTGTVAGTLYRAYLYAGNTLIGTESVNAATIVFDDLEYMIDEDETETFRVEVDFNDGDVVTATELTVVDVTVDGEDADFDPVTITASVDETHNLITTGLIAEIDEITSLPQNDGKQLTITYVMDVTAYEEDYFISATGSVAFDETITGPGTTTVDSSQVTVSGVTKNGATNTFRIQKGQTRTVTVSYIVTDTVGGFINAKLDTLNYGSAANAPATLEDTLGAPDFEITGASVTAFGS